MVTEHVAILFLLLFCTPGIDTTDITDGLSNYSIVQPQLLPNQKYDGDEHISYVLKVDNKPHILHLKRNRDFLHPDLFVADNRTATHPRHVHCYYHGEVEGYENSVVALSTCYGLRGVILFANESYGIEPLPHSATHEHLLYRLIDFQTGPVFCGVLHEATETQSHEPFEAVDYMSALLRKKRNLPQTRYVELVLVVDNLRYQFRQRNETAIREEMVEMANLLDGYYRQLNIRVALVGVEIFKDANPFPVEGSAGDVLRSFVRWRRSDLLPRNRHDVAQLLVGRPGSFPGNVLGMAFVGSVCSVTSSGGITVFGNNQLLFASTVVAHEMGHNLGMNHDNTRCNCDGQPCIMAASASGSTSFSRCSAEDFEALILSGRGVCLANQPSLSDVVDTAQCGNGMLEEGEECDCGTPEECQNNCCVAATCQLSAGSACAQGECCNDCQLRVSGTPCRGVVNSCDLPEFCNGTSAFCPDDFYMMDGLPCENNAAYCYEGRCQTYDSQCKRLFAPDPATKAADTCFQHLNTKGNLFGNCGITSSGDYIKCAVADAMCGKVQCTNVDVNHPPPDAHVSIQVINGSTCVNADFNLGPDVLDPAYVNAGSPCAEGKTCLDFKCVDASALLPNLDCDAQQTCNGRGVCNDQGHCHCDDGWSPPNCNRAGTGGSIDSGPNKINFSLRNGLLIFFLAVVPLLVLLVLLLLFFFRRDTFNPCLKPTRRSRSSHAGNANGRSNGNIETHATTRIPRELPPQRLDNPPATSAPVTRYGELDYWNTSSASAHGQVPRQGPGVPRPITSRQSPK
ncbi:disintegrin and metalloproteinase domain-containing protein 9 isoform X1 [Dunckerocampus dactyliophorus]|uniref:disintegrin and metalloproteinase domain-containing protein 9 isoform X1 n=1 Tax=Dunckerocampus dactyliophorus TaxID=161453 RepID=UPI002405BC9E|nr:disintegrin and metalloproteinase domain-containing protein 9 isoform X1 [Dunckerocampus dactyliophorus]